MRIVHLPGTSIDVSELSFGGLTLGRLQADIPPREGAKVIRKALKLGVNLIETSELYGTYPHISAAIRGWSQEVVLALKSKEHTYDGMLRSVENALAQLGVTRISIFSLHMVESAEDLAQREAALRCLVDLRSRGVIQAIGLTTHSPEGVRAALAYEAIQVIHPLMNMTGFGIVDGTREDMLSAIRVSKVTGKSLIAMKPLAGGNLILRMPSAIAYLRELGLFHSICVGMKTAHEVEMNVRLFEQRPIPQWLVDRVSSDRKRVHVYDRCQRCGKCESVCDQGAIRVGQEKAIVDPTKCILCGYCASECPESAIRVW